ncbi:MAG: hypothetical protein LBH33_00395, partial [Endomicrobium sp.]|nr:hypothetical protein [Endomicrobium sp.]
NDSFLLEGLVKRLSYYRWKVLNLTYKYYRSYSSFWFRIFPLLITPCSIMLIIRFFYRLLIKKFIFVEGIITCFEKYKLKKF